MRVLVACEFSGRVRDAFRALGHDAISCDLLPSTASGPHVVGDVRSLLRDGWDLMVAHPPCTWLCQAMRANAARKDRPRITAVFEQERARAFEFVQELAAAPIPAIAIENPIGYLNSAWRKPDQVARPFMFGHPFSKDICLWLRGLDPLRPTQHVEPPYRRLDFWSGDRNPGGYSRKSVTFTGIAAAMAQQWGGDSR